MNDVIKATEPRDIIAAASAALGFRPTDSLVVLSLRGTTKRFGPVARTDLAALNDPAAAANLAQALSEHADTTILIAYSDDPAARRRGIDAASKALAETHTPTMDAWWVSATAYGSATCPDPTCCPTQGWPLTDIDASLVRAETTLLGTVIAPTRDALLPTPATPADRRQAEAARLAWIAEHGATARTGDPTTDETRATTALAAWTEPYVLGRDTVHDPEIYGRLAAVLSDVTWRDLVIAFIL